MNLKIAIIALTRGYPEDKSKYDTLIKRNKAIYEKINSLREIPTDLLLFHEDNLSLKDQEYINNESPEEIKFINVSKYFKNEHLILDGEEKFSLGYRQMCRFHMYYLWDEVSNYDYILRVDEDIEIVEFNPNIFEFMQSKKINYLTGRFTKDTHRLTNQTLPYYLIENSKLNVRKVYNHRNPYTNLYASSVKFWKKDDIQLLLKKIATSDQQIINRWGDHTVQGIVLNHKNEKIKLFPKLEYSHISHSLVIKNNLFRNLTINSRLNPVSITGGFFNRVKQRIKGILKNNNKYDFDRN
tara:strand:+ start:626 stop:1516 length:891 start_codon:yes stop_codon:yes gene_type:complete